MDGPRQVVNAAILMEVDWDSGEWDTVAAIKLEIREKGIAEERVGG